MMMYGNNFIALNVLACLCSAFEISTAYNTHFNTPVSAKSCMDHFRRGASEDGYYQIVVNGKATLTVFCDFSTEPGSAWTLVESWSMKMKDLVQLKARSLKQDAPVFEKTPNWELYRMSHTGMAAIRKVSTHWRATCSLHAYKVDYQDYMVGNFNDFDVMTFESTVNGQCKKVDYVNIRGHKAVNTQVRIWQVTNTYHITIDSSSDGCQFVPTAGSVSSEDNFGFYDTINPKFRCTSSPSSTTQWWFGEYL